MRASRVRVMGGGLVLLACAGVAGCSSQARTRRKDFVFAFGGTTGRFEPASGCGECGTGASLGFLGEFGYMLGSAERVAAFVTADLYEAWSEPRNLRHGLVGAGLRYWPLQRLSFSGVIGASVTAGQLGEEEIVGDGAAGRLEARFGLLSWRSASLDLGLGVTMGGYQDVDGYDLHLSLTVNGFFDFKAAGPDPIPPSAAASPPATH